MELDSRQQQTLDEYKRSTRVSLDRAAHWMEEVLKEPNLAARSDMITNKLIPAVIATSELHSALCLVKNMDIIPVNVKV